MGTCLPNGGGTHSAEGGGIPASSGQRTIPSIPWAAGTMCPPERHTMRPFPPPMTMCTPELGGQTGFCRLRLDLEQTETGLLQTETRLNARGWRARLDFTD